MRGKLWISSYSTDFKNCQTPSLDKAFRYAIFSSILCYLKINTVMKKTEFFLLLVTAFLFFPPLACPASGGRFGQGKGNVSKDSPEKKESQGLVGLVSISWGWGALSIPSQEGADKRFYSKLSGGIGWDWLTVGGSISYHNENEGIQPGPPYGDAIGRGIFLRASGEDVLPLPLCARYEIGWVQNLYHSFAFEFGRNNDIGIMVGLDVFKGLSPSLSFGMIFPFAFTSPRQTR